MKSSISWQEVVAFLTPFALAVAVAPFVTDDLGAAVMICALLVTCVVGFFVATK